MPYLAEERFGRCVLNSDHEAAIAAKTSELEATKRHLVDSNKGAERNSWISQELAKKNNELQATLATVSIERDEAKKDSERLIWMVEHGAFIWDSRDGEVCTVWTQARRGEEDTAQPVEGYPLKSYRDWREAIDAARKAQP